MLPQEINILGEFFGWIVVIIVGALSQSMVFVLIAPSMSSTKRVNRLIRVIIYLFVMLGLTFPSPF
jgi:hypothetical protein